MAANRPPRRNPKLPNRWEDEAIPEIDENALRGQPEWLARIGDEDEAEATIEQNLAEEWGRTDEDDYVSSPVTQSDQPDWTDKEYDSEPGGPEDDTYLYS
jgi:hypothetical protein